MINVHQEHNPEVQNAELKELIFCFPLTKEKIAKFPPILHSEILESCLYLTHFTH